MLNIGIFSSKYLDHKKVFNNVETLIFIISFMLFSLIILLEIHTDLQSHIGILQKYIKHNSLPSTPLFYVTVLFLAFFNTETLFLTISVVLLLSICVTLKYITSQKVYTFLTLKNKKNKYYRYTKAVFPLVLIVAPIYSGSLNFHLGKAGINIWHNSTIIFLMPLAILLFYYAIKFIINHNTQALYFIFLFSVLNILAKPSYFLIFAPTFFLITFIKYGFSKPFYLAILTLVLSSLILLSVYFLTYSNSKLDSIIYNGQTSKVVLAPFTVWKIWSNNIPLDFISSIAFPVTFLSLYFKDIKNNIVIIFSSIQFIIAILIFVLLAESGPRLTHGNFIWQVIVANYILFLVCFTYFNQINNKLKIINYKLILTYIVFLLHALAGIIYIFKLLITGNYY